MKQTRGSWRLVYADAQGELQEDDRLFALGSSALRDVSPGAMVPIPPGTTLSLLPGCRAAGLTNDGDVHEADAADARPVAALLPTGYARLLAPSYRKEADAPHLPLFGYSAVASRSGKIFVSAFPLDPGRSWDPRLYNTPDLETRVNERLVAEPHNRLLAHHGKCALEYGCYTAQNIFYRRNEMAIAVSVACNAACVGCISDQPEDVTAPHTRMTFTPAVEEIVSLALPQLEEAENAIVSFGQGCEGEPLLRARLIGRAIAALRQRTSRGQIHLNTNGSNARAVQHLIDTGLDSIRVSMFSALERQHTAYYGPRNYGLEDMEDCLIRARGQGLHTSVNLLTYPGFQDVPEEADTLINFFRRTGVQLVQLRTLSMDRELLQEKVGFPNAPGIGIDMLVSRMRSEVTGLEVGTRTPFVGRARVHVH